MQIASSEGIGGALAGHTRASLQAGSASDIVRTFLLREALQDPLALTTANHPAAGQDNP